MNNRQRLEMMALQGTQGVINANAGEVPGVAAAGAKKELDSILVQLDPHVAAQSLSTVAARTATKTHYASRRTLVYEHMATIATVAKVNVAKVPELAVLRMPKPHSSIQRLLTTAEDMANGVKPYEAVFVTAGLPANFVQQLQDAAAAMLDAVNERDGYVAKVVGATKGIRTLLAEGRQQVAILDRLMQVEAKDNASLLATWNQVKRVPKSKAGSPAAVAVAPAALSLTPATVPVAAVAPVSPVATATAAAA